MAGHPLRSATDRRLGEPLPHQLPNQTRAHLIPPEFLPPYHAALWSYAVLAVISNCYPPVWGRLSTRYSPVRHSVTYTFLPKNSSKSASFDLHVLGTPPAFILSQDQTLVKSVCIQSRIAWQFCSCLLLLGWHWTLDEAFHESSVKAVRLCRTSSCLQHPFLKNLFKEFSGLLSIVQLSKSVVLSHSTALTVYHVQACLSRLFLFSFSPRFLSSDSFNRLSYLSTFVNNFFTQFVFKCERRKRDLNPRAGYPTYTLSRGTSSASWVLLQTPN